MSEMKRCPFCGEKIREDFPYFYYHEKMKTWIFNHSCKDDGTEIYIQIYGDTREAVIERWNHRGKGQKNKSSRNS